MSSTSFEEIEGITLGQELIEKTNLAALILGENQEPLSKLTIQSTLENTCQYNANDLVVVDWNSAVVLRGPLGQQGDMPEMLEFALTHLLEVRYYDDLIDKRLSELYDEIERERTGTPQFLFCKTLQGCQLPIHRIF